MKKALILLAILAIGMPLFAQALTFRFGENYSLKKDEQVVGDMYIAGGNTAVSGKISGDLHIAGSEVQINDGVSGDVYITADKIIIGDSANIVGYLSYASSRPAIITEGARKIG